LPKKIDLNITNLKPLQEIFFFHQQLRRSL